MTRYKILKKEIAFQLGKYFPITIQSGICKGTKLYGDIFYNKRMSYMNDEEILYASLNLMGATILEVGAHIGIYTTFLAKKAIGGRILAFEPNPLNFHFLSKNLAINCIDNAQIINAGLSDNKGEQIFSAKRYNSATGTFKRDKQALMEKQKTKITKRSVPVFTIDDVIEKFKLDIIDFIKIDTEGFEPFVLSGAIQTIKRYKPVLYFEIHGLTENQKHDDLSNIFHMISPFHYNIHKLTRGLTQVTVNNIVDVGGGGFVAYYEDRLNIKKALMNWL